MKKHSYGKLIGMSWGWAKEILFRPFILKKWIMLAVIIFLAGQMGGGINLNFNLNRADFEGFIGQINEKAPGVVMPQAPDLSIDPQILTQAIIVGAFIVIFIGIFILLWLWVNSNFSFVFIDSIVRNDASLRVPFHRNKAQGNSYFRWNIVFGLMSLLVFGGIILLPAMQLIRSGAFTAAPIDIRQILLVISRYVPVLLGAGMIFFLIAFFTRNFVLPVMYKKKIGILSAWKVFLGILRKNAGEMLKYILVRIALFILVIIIAIIVAIIGIIALLLVGALVGLIGWLIYAVTPAPAKGVVGTVLGIAAVPIFAFLGFLFIILFIPIPVFFRTFSIHVLGSIDESLDIFAPKTAEEIATEASDAKYKKSMRLVWFTVLSPILFVLVALLLAIAIPNFIVNRGDLLQMRQPGLEKIMPFREMPAPSLLPIRKGTGETVTVYLTNGNSFEAEIARETEHNIAFRVEGGTFVLLRSEILRIEK